MRWEGQTTEAIDAQPGLLALSNVVRSVTTPEFAGLTFHEVHAKSALNRVPQASSMPFSWTVNPYRGCSHACVYCFARSSHEYLGLDGGADFDSQVVVKVNIAEVLRGELAKRSWKREPVAMGTNTDPYQRAEGRYALMPGIIEALADSGTPFSILTKGTMLRRDLPLLSRAAEDVPVHLSMSIAVMDDELQRTLEPGTPSGAARLATVRAASEAGLRVSVFLMPVLPFLTDSREQLAHSLDLIKDAGAASVTYGALHLRPGIKEWYARWLNTYRPDLTPKYRALYGDSSNAPKSYRQSLAARVRPLIAERGLSPRDNDDYGRSDRSVNRVTARDADGEMRAKPAPASALVGAGETLF